MTTIDVQPAIPVELTPLRPRPTGFFHDTASIAGPRAAGRAQGPVCCRAARAHRVLLLRREHRDAQEPHGGLDLGLRLHRLPDAHRDPAGCHRCVTRPALVLDVQDGYLDRLLLTPVRRLSILVGHMVADVVVAAALTIPILVLGFILGVRFESGPAGHRRVHRDGRCVEPRVRGVRLRDRAEDGEPRRGPVQLPAVLPVPLPHHRLRAA